MLPLASLHCTLTRYDMIFFNHNTLNNFWFCYLFSFIYLFIVGVASEWLEHKDARSISLLLHEPSSTLF